jgi:hypothetical protein
MNNHSAAVKLFQKDYCDNQNEQPGLAAFPKPHQHVITTSTRKEYGVSAPKSEVDSNTTKRLILG